MHNKESLGVKTELSQNARAFLSMFCHFWKFFCQSRAQISKKTLPFLLL